MRFWLRIGIQVMMAMVTTVAVADSYDDFFRAVGIDNQRAVRALLERGIDPNTPNEQGELPLSLAIREDAPRVAEMLMAHPALRVDAANANDETPLMIAALMGRVDWVERLIDRGARVERRGWTPLHYAASGPEPRAVEVLVERGADVGARSPNGSTPLMMAAGYGDQRSAQYLLRRGADPNARNERGLGAADFARQAGRDRLADEIDRAARGAGRR